MSAPQGMTMYALFAALGSRQPRNSQPDHSMSANPAGSDNRRASPFEQLTNDFLIISSPTGSTGT
jgi:hypothetical protein